MKHTHATPLPLSSGLSFRPNVTLSFLHNRTILGKLELFSFSGRMERSRCLATRSRALQVAKWACFLMLSGTSTLCVTRFRRYQADIGRLLYSKSQSIYGHFHYTEAFPVSFPSCMQLTNRHGGAQEIDSAYSVRRCVPCGLARHRGCWLKLHGPEASGNALW
jgi:hypothetical protein